MTFTIIIWAYMLTFTVLKLCGEIDWSWYVIYSPLLVSFAINTVDVIAEKCSEDYRRAKEKKRIEKHISEIMRNIK